MIEVKNISKNYNTKKKNELTALKDINFTLPSTGMFFILGKSGSGKSTLLNILALLDNPTSGEILIDGKNINKLKEKEKTNYRNKKIGFIFQEFNLFEELNVYDNVELALNLKGIRKTKKNIQDIIDSVDLIGKIYAKTNELSGGEKQRVAIARALIKDPKIILADEPTGNLDNINSEKIFNILKSISKKHLVIIVTHDEDSALKYADGIIEISDGKIIKNNINLTNKKNNPLEELNKCSHIPIIKKLKLAFGLIKTKKLRLVITSLIVSIAFALFGISTCLLNFNVYKTEAETMKKEKENTLIISKDIDNVSLGSYLFPKDIDTITKKLDSEYQKQSILYQNNSNFKLDSVLSPISPDFKKDYEDNAYYGYIALLAHSYDTYVKTYSLEKLKELNILGEIPTNANEILISESFADFLTKYDSIYYSYDDVYKTYLSDFKKYNSLEEILNSKLYLDSYDNYLIIKGIIRDDKLTRFEPLKNENYDKMENEPTELYKEFKTYIKNNCFNIVVNDNFFTNLSLKKNNEIDYYLYKKSLTIDDNKLYNLQNYTTVKETNNCYDGNKVEDKCLVNDGEIIIGNEVINKLFKNEINNDLNKLITNAIEDYASKERAREQKVQEQQKICEETGNCEFEEIPITPEPDLEKIEKDFYYNLIKKNSLIGKHITFDINDTYGYIETDKTFSYDLEIVGINLDNDKNYVNEEQFKEYLMPYELVTSFKVTEDKEESLENIFRDFKDLPYKVTTKFSSEFLTISKIINSLEKIAIYVVIGFLIFAVIMLTLFITSNIGSNKKKIGILKAIGTRTSDIVKIFWWESLFISILSFVLSIFLTLIGINFTNLFITKEISFYIRPLIFDIYTLLFLFIIVLLVNLVSFIIPTIKISKLKPIDLIKDI